jgi:hypothetical protein
MFAWKSRSEARSSKGSHLAGPRRSVPVETAPNKGPMSHSFWDFGKIPLFSPDRAPRAAEPPRTAAPLKGVLQTKLAVGAVNDPLEREADAVADAVMRMADSALSISAVSPQVSRKCAECEEEEKKSFNGRLRAERRHAASAKRRRSCMTCCGSPGGRSMRRRARFSSRGLGMTFLGFGYILIPARGNPPGRSVPSATASGNTLSLATGG